MAADTITLLSNDSVIQTWIYHTLAIQTEDGLITSDSGSKQPARLSTTHDVEPTSQPISPTSDSVDMHANLTGLGGSLDFLAFRPLQHDIPESISSTIISAEEFSEQLERLAGYHYDHPDHHPDPIASTSRTSRDTHMQMLYRMFPKVDFDFDHSCLDELDEQLLDHPTHSFAATCWAEATKEIATYSSYRTRCPLSFFDNASRLSLDSDSSQSDSTATPGVGIWASEREDEKSSFNFTEEEEILFDNEETIEHSRCNLVPPFRVITRAGFSATDLDEPPAGHGFAPIEPLPRREILDSCFTGPNPKDAIHYYPVSPLARELRARPDRKRLGMNRGLGIGRITAFCATLPRRLIHPISASS